MKKLHFEWIKEEDGGLRLQPSNSLAATEDRVQVCLHATTIEEKEDRIFPVFRQAAMAYGQYSEYLKHHGCASCSLTSTLAAFVDKYRDLTPDQMIAQVESQIFGRQVWEENYRKKGPKQMPVSLYGISCILSHYGIAHKYVRNFQWEKAEKEIRNHLREGKQVIIETRKIKKKGWILYRLNDKKYAGSYHTMICLGMDQEGQVLFTDSAYRQWSGEKQRVKRAPLSDLLFYMYGKEKKGQEEVYFHSRLYTGGYILLEAEHLS